MTRSSINARSPPSTDRAVVSNPSSPPSTRLITVSAVRPFVPLAVANCVSTVFGTPTPRCANPYAR